jgi:hypothetical protein
MNFIYPHKQSKKPLTHVNLPTIQSNNPKVVTQSIVSSIDSTYMKFKEVKSKETHRQCCLKQLDILDKNLPPFIYSPYETILIEFRPLIHLEFLIRNTILQLPKWSHTVVCGNNNYDMIHTWFPTLNIIKFDLNNITSSEYSDLLMTKSFWNIFKGEKLLIYQEDSMLFHNNIKPFLNYDYIGAPWPIDQNDNEYGVGNGGFSLRTKSVMLKCLQYKKLNVIEDVFFSSTMLHYKIGLIAPINIAIEFSQENLKSFNPLGGHQYWNANELTQTSHETHSELIHKYPNLFHKYLLKIRNPETDIPYTVLKSTKNTNEFVCHLHCFNLDEFESIYGEYIDNLISEYDIIITFIQSTKRVEYPVTILKINNMGFDIGGKLCCLQYLKDIDAPYNYLLFLHSKSNETRRRQYFEPLIKNMYRIKQCKLYFNTKNVSGIFPNIIWDLNTPSEHDVFESNKMYCNELCEYLNVKQHFLFAEGNCFMCTKQIIDAVFVNYKLFYNMLNTETSFDYNWMSIYLKDKSSIESLYKKTRSVDFCFGTIRDAMIEHAFERIWIDVIKSLNQNYLILD